MSININQFAQTPVRGQLDLQISKDGVLSGQISANEAGELQVGDPVILDAANTNINNPQFKLAGQDATAIGYIARSVKRSGGLVSGDPVEVAFLGGPVMWMTAAATIAPGAAVEQAASTTGADVQTLTSHSQRGIALDPGTTGNLLRVIIYPAAA